MATIHADLTALIPQQQAAAQRAFATWEYTLQNDIDIYVTVLGVDLRARRLNGLCVPNLVQGPNITATTAQGKAFGTAPFVVATDANDPDMVIFIDNSGNSKYNYTNNAVNREANFETLILHEMCHGLGFLGLCNVEQHPNIGIFSDTNLIQILQPLQVLIPFWGQLNALHTGLPTLFAQAFVNAVTNTPAYGDQPNVLYDLFTTPNSMYINTTPVPPNLVQQYQVYTSDPFHPFTSCDHLNYNSRPSDQGGDGCLMATSTGWNVITTPDYRTKGILQTIGWNIHP